MLAQERNANLIHIYLEIIGTNKYRKKKHVSSVMYLEDICSRPTAQSSLHTVVLLAVIQTVSDKYIVTYYYTILYIYYTIYYTVLDNVQAGRIEPPSGPILVRRPYV